MHLNRFSFGSIVDHIRTNSLLHIEVWPFSQYPITYQLNFLSRSVNHANLNYNQLTHEYESRLLFKSQSLVEETTTMAPKKEYEEQEA